jgi:hypothetical protein
LGVRETLLALGEFKDVDIVLDTTDLVKWLDINKFYLTQSDKIKILAYIFLPNEFEPYTNTEIDKIENLLKDFK